MKYWIALLLALLLALGTTATAETLYVFFSPSGTSLDDLPMINARFNEYLADKLEGVSVQLVLPEKSCVTAVHNALLQGTQVDIAFCNNAEYMNEWIRSGWLCPLDDLLREDGKGITAQIADEYMYRQDDVIYGVGNQVEHGRSFGFEYLLDVAEMYHLDMSAVHTLQDLTTVFRQLKEQTDEVVPTVVCTRYMKPEDILGNKYGVLLYHDDQAVSNLFESDEYWDLLDLVYDWTQSGYTYDRFSDSNRLIYYMQSGKIFGALCTGKPGFAAQETFLTGHRMGYLEFVPYTQYSALNRAYSYVIPKTSADPQTAMRLLNLIYQDSYLANLLIYGVEGIHYDKVTENSVIKRADSHYCGINGYTYCNQYVAYTFAGASETLWQEMLEADATAPRSTAYGFVFDDSGVKDQIIRCDAVYAEYTDLLFSGEVDPRLLRDEVTAAYRKAGIDDIIAEKQRQFALFLSEKDANE